jgi:hypothetical protein
MVLTDFYQQSDDQIRFSRQQASRFAKEMANDFNPLHDTDAKMFCVPGDLLFSVSLNRLGLSQQMRFTFSGMVSDEAVIFPDSDAPRIDISDGSGKCCLTIERHGETTRDTELIKHLVTHYVAFSGKTFPHVLVPLMSEQGVMINPARPLAIYQQREIQLDRLNLSRPILEATGSSLEVSGKKGMTRFDFKIIDDGKAVGKGTKHMSLRGLRPFDDRAMTELVEEYNGYRERYLRQGD